MKDVDKLFDGFDVKLNVSLKITLREKVNLLILKQYFSDRNEFLFNLLLAKQNYAFVKDLLLCASE